MGELDYYQNCAMCHGPLLEGQLGGYSGPALKGEVWFDGQRMEKFTAPASDAVRRVEVPPVFLSEGPASLELRTKTGALPVRSVAVRDGLRIHTDPIRSVPMDPLATPAAQKLLAFLVAESGHHILSGQQDLTWNDGVDMTARVKQITGKEPALMGYDFLNYLSTTPGVGGRGQTEEAIAWSNRNRRGARSRLRRSSPAPEAST